jgi:hypothetical protein
MNSTITMDDSETHNPPHSYVVKTRTGFDARCYRTTKDPNRIGYIVCESHHRTEKAAAAAAKRFHKEFGGTINDTTCT